MSIDLMGWGKVSEFLTSVLDRVVQDPQAKSDAAFKLAELEQQGEFKLLDAQLQQMKAQTDINLVEAQSDKLFVSGWRPAIGWICASALLYQYLLRPLMPWALNSLGFHVDVPIALDGTLSELVYGMLGFGLLRSVDKAVPHLTK